MELIGARKEETNNEGVANFVQKKESKGEEYRRTVSSRARGEGGTYTDTTRLPIPTPLSLPANPIAIR